MSLSYLLIQEQVEERWKKAMHTHATSAVLWQRYLSHASSHLGRFRLSTVVSQFVSALEQLTYQTVRNLHFLYHLALKANSFGAQASIASRNLATDKLEDTLLEVFTTTCQLQSNVRSSWVSNLAD